VEAFFIVDDAHLAVAHDSLNGTRRRRTACPTGARGTSTQDRHLCCVPHVYIGLN
jgi:hypothetical protein